MRAKTKAIDPQIEAILRGLKIDGNLVRIEQVLDRKTYVKVNEALEALGGKWDRKRKAHVFASDPRPAIHGTVEAGSFESVRDAEKEAGFFPTPPALARKIVAMADIQPGDQVLEPSAGKGAIADEIVAVSSILGLTTCELLEGNADMLHEKGYAPVVGDFLKWDPRIQFDKIVMNPPFEKQADIDHVRHAYGMLAPGGRLVAIMSAGVEFRENAKAKAFALLMREANGTLERNPPGSFVASGTNVNTVVVTLTKPLTNVRDSVQIPLQPVDFGLVAVREKTDTMEVTLDKPRNGASVTVPNEQGVGELVWHKYFDV